MGYFTLAEWETGLIDLQCDSIDKLRSKLEQMRMLLNEPNAFKGIYRYAYQFAKDKDQRSMDAETAKVMLQLLLADKWPIYGEFCRFIDQSTYKVINRDQWINIFEFARLHCDDLSSYDIDGACKYQISCIEFESCVECQIFSSTGPVMLDEFVIWMRRQTDEKMS